MDMVCIVFDDTQKADACLSTLRSLTNQALLDLEDACVAIRDESGEVYLKQASPRAAIGVTIGIFSGMAWGLMLAVLCMFHPVVGTAAGAVVAATAGGLIGKLNDFGIDDGFMQQIARELRPGTSAIFALFGRVASGKVLPHLGQFNGKLLTSTLPPEREERLRMALAADQQAGNNPPVTSTVK